MFANKSADYPEGYLNQVTLKSFYAMSGPDNALVYTPGNERIPDNWYTRAVGDPYDIPFFMSDFATLVQQHPELLSFGGNTGTVNSFTGLDIGNLTVRFSSSSSLTFPQNQNLPATHSKKKKQGGLYNAATLLQGNNLACYILLKFDCFYRSIQQVSSTSDNKHKTCCNMRWYANVWKKSPTATGLSAPLLRNPRCLDHRWSFKNQRDARHPHAEVFLLALPDDRSVKLPYQQMLLVSP